MITLTLYSTAACHLCELAQGMIQAEMDAGVDGGAVVEIVDISDNDGLFARYGTRIPVLRHPDGRELDWPFTAPAVRGLLRAGSG